MQSQVELMRINFEFEAPIIQVQIITYLLEVRMRTTSVWGKNNGNITIFQ